MKFKIYISIIFIITTFKVISQKSFFGDIPHNWTEKNQAWSIVNAAKNKDDDVVCLSENTEFSFYSTSNQKIIKNAVYKINSEAGLQKFKTYSLPESFDIAFDEGYYKQGRKAKIKIPYISHYKLVNFTSRKFIKPSWQELVFSTNFQNIKWIPSNGVFITDEITNVEFKDLKVGDIVEIYYEAEFGTTYGSNLFYFNSKYPKVQCEYNFNYKVDDKFEDYAFILPVNIKDSLVLTNVEPYDKNSKVFKKTILLKDLEPINYAQNGFVSKQFPYVYADFRFYKIATGSYPDGTLRVIEWDIVRPRNFEWLLIRDTTNSFVKIYDKQFASVRQFLKKMPTITNDSSKIVFVKTFCDTLNSFNYINSNDLYYNKSDIYDLYSGDHLLKRRLVEHLVWKITIDILNENKIQYYRTNIQDNRFGEHNMKYRSNFGYEDYIIALSSNSSYIYFVPRRNGVAYFMNELPFYYEGSLAALTARNFQESDKNKQVNYFKLIKTHKGTWNENSRIENTTVRINTDSSVAYLNTRESLSGQYSTILRHLYFNTYIDSTISSIYFKKCTEKPKAEQVKIKLSSKITEYPFRHNFSCSEKIALDSKAQLNLKNWFSFVVPGNITEAPQHDYYFDFENTDAYNFVLMFAKPTEIENTSEFEKVLENETFTFNSNIVKQDNNNYLLKVEMKVKTRKLSKANANDLVKLSKIINELNGFILKLKQT